MTNDLSLSRLRQLLSQRESIRLEFKEARTALPDRLFETICAMLNRDGGDILLGVDDEGHVMGVDPSSAETLKANLVNLSNNPQKLDPPFILLPTEHTLDGKIILHLAVPASSQIHKSGGFVFDRGDAGDFRVAQPHRIAEISNRKRLTYTEDTIYPAIRPQDLRLDLLPRIRNLIRSRMNQHPWLELSDEQLLLKAGLYQRNWETGKEGYTLAAVLLLGPDEMIHGVIPHYKTDALLRREQVDRYDDRDTIYCNIIEAYDRLMAFIAKHLPDPFHLEGDVRVSLRDKIFREVIANLLIHREYMNAYPARLVIYRDRVETTNASNARTEGTLSPESVVPFSKNPTIAKFLAQLGWAEELGSGMMNIGRYLPLYTPSGRPEYRDGPVFTAIIPLAVSRETSVTGTGIGAESSEQVTEHVGEQVTEQVGRVLVVLQKQTLSGSEIMKRLVLAHRPTFLYNYLQPAIQQGWVEMTIPDKPRSRLQKYRLTPQGRKALEAMRKEMGNGE